MKKIEIEIPEGKKAEWVDGVLTLVDEKPQDITERIKTFDDAVKALGDNHPLVSQCYRAIAAFKYEPMSENLIAYTKLRVICAALNEGWKPTLDGEGYRYYVWFYIYTKEEYEKLDEEEKAHCVPLRSYNNANANGGLVCAYAVHAGSGSHAGYGVRLALKTRELAEYCSKQFIDIWADFLFG